MVRVKTGLGEVSRYQGRLWEGGRKLRAERNQELFAGAEHVVEVFFGLTFSLHPLFKPQAQDVCRATWVSREEPSREGGSSSPRGL